MLLYKHSVSIFRINVIGLPEESIPILHIFGHGQHVQSVVTNLAVDLSFGLWVGAVKTTLYANMRTFSIRGCGSWPYISEKWRSEGTTCASNNLKNTFWELQGSFRSVQRGSLRSRNRWKLQNWVEAWNVVKTYIRQLSLRKSRERRRVSTESWCGGVLNWVIVTWFPYFMVLTYFYCVSMRIGVQVTALLQEIVSRSTTISKWSRKPISASVSLQFHRGY